MILHGIEVSLIVILQGIFTPKYKRTNLLTLCASFAIVCSTMNFFKNGGNGYHVRNILSQNWVFKNYQKSREKRRFSWYKEGYTDHWWGNILLEDNLSEFAILLVDEKPLCFSVIFSFKSAS